MKKKIIYRGLSEIWQPWLSNFGNPEKYNSDSWVFKLPTAYVPWPMGPLTNTSPLSSWTHLAVQRWGRNASPLILGNVPLLHNSWLVECVLEVDHIATVLMAEITSPPAKGANRLNHESDEIGQGEGGVWPIWTSYSKWYITTFQLNILQVYMIRCKP